MLVHHPYDSFQTSVEAFLAQAAADPDVLAIKHTLYRTSGPSNPVALTLIRAAEAGKQVVTLVELKARFDEEANIEWARTLEQAGVHVVYGLVGLKTHGKVALVVRREGGGIRRYCHVGTGNYNPATATTYEDVGLLSASPELGADLSELFNFLTGYGRPPRYRKLLVAPAGLRSALLAQIQPGGGGAGRPHRAQGQCPGGPGADRRALRGLGGGGRDRPGGARDLLPAAGRPRALRADPGALAGGPLPRALAHLPLRERGARPALLHRLGGPDDAQPRPAGRGGGADRVARSLPAPGGDPGHQPGGRHPRLGAGSGGRLDPGARAAPGIDTHQALLERARLRANGSADPEDSALLESPTPLPR